MLNGAAEVDLGLEPAVADTIPYAEVSWAYLYVGVALVLGFIFGVWADSLRLGHFGALKKLLQRCFLSRELMGVEAVAAEVAGPAPRAPGTLVGVAALSAVQEVQSPAVRRRLLGPALAVFSRFMANGRDNSSTSPSAS